jgi:hypothetical protein
MLEFETTYPSLRVYFNSKAAYPYVWSIDDGNTHNELITTNVVAQGISEFVYKGQKPNALHPVAWAQFRNARIYRLDDTQVVIVENTVD